MHLSHLSLLFSALLLASTAHAQRARCVDANGFGYECSGRSARAAEQHALTPAGPSTKRSIDLGKLGTSEWEDTSRKPSQAPPSEGSRFAPPIQHKPDPLDAWPIHSYTRP